MYFNIAIYKVLKIHHFLAQNQIEMFFNEIIDSPSDNQETLWIIIFNFCLLLISNIFCTLRQ